MKHNPSRIALSAIIISMLTLSFCDSSAAAKTEATSAPEAISRQSPPETIAPDAVPPDAPAESISAAEQSASTSASPPAVAAPQTLEDKLIVPWNEMNLRFRDSYAKARRLKVDALGPIAIFREDKIILRYKNKREEFLTIPQQFTLLKSVSHIPLAAFVMLEGKTDSKLDDDTIKTLREFRESIDKASSNLDEWKLSSKSLDRQKQIIEAGKNMFDTAVKNGYVSSDSLLTYTRSMGPLVLENAFESISMELDIIDSKLKTWKATIAPEDWKHLRVAVMQPHMPREQNSIMQYLQKMLKQPYEGESIIYGEGKNEEDYALDLIGTHILDRRVAVNFFKDPWRMHRDLLSDGAKRYLKNHRPLSD
jgi:hypothetical protein